MTTTGGDVERGAVLSACGLYRYSLTRRWAPGEGVAFVMLNPSTADATTDDPTVRKVVKFSRAWGAPAVEVVNLFAFRATEPWDLIEKARDPIGPENDAHILAAVDRARSVVIAWGVTVMGTALEPRMAAVLRLLLPFRPKVYALKLTNSGQPGHPLYLADKTHPRLYPDALWPAPASMFDKSKPVVPGAVKSAGASPASRTGGGGPSVTAAPARVLPPAAAPKVRKKRASAPATPDLFGAPRPAPPPPAPPPAPVTIDPPAGQTAPAPCEAGADTPDESDVLGAEVPAPIPAGGPPEVGQRWLCDLRGRVPWSTQYSERTRGVCEVVWSGAPHVYEVVAQKGQGFPVRTSLPRFALLERRG